MKIYMTVSNTDETRLQTPFDLNECLLTLFEKLPLFIKVIRAKRIIGEITQVVSAA